MAKKAIIFSTDDVNGDGRKDLSLMVGENRLFTLYDVKNVFLKILGAAGGTTIGGLILSTIGIIG